MGNEHLFHVIRTTMKGYSIYSGHSERLPFAVSFSEKEISVVRLVCQGMTRSEMAEKLDMSEAMVKQHITSILNKTGFDTVAKFAVYATSQGFVAPDIF